MPIDISRGCNISSTGAMMRIYGEAVRDEREILQIRRIRLTELLAEGGLSAKLDEQLRNVLAEVEGRLAGRIAPALEQAA